MDVDENGIGASKRDKKKTGSGKRRISPIQLQPSKKIKRLIVSQKNVDLENSSTSSISNSSFHGRDGLASSSNPPVNKIRCNFNPIESFDSKEDVEKYIANHGCLYEQSRNTTKEGTTIYYYCSMTKTRDSSKCPVKLKVFENSETQTFGVSFTTFIHDHSEVNLKKATFSENVKKDIFTMKMQFGLKPRKIFEYIKKNTQTNHCRIFIK